MSSIKYETETVEKMIRLYCRKKHGTKKGELCAECEALNLYAREKLGKCPFGDEKGACAVCDIHCYRAGTREQMRKIMRFSGPRMLLYYPFDFAIHFLKDRTKKQKS